MKEVEAKGGLGKISTRYLLCVLGSVALGIVYGLKVNFHVAIVSMVNHTAVGGGGHGEEATEDGPFVWPKFVQGLLLSSYFWGYIVAELPGGRVAEMFSAKWVMFFSVAINVVGAILTPIMAEWHYGALLVVRVCQGTQYRLAPTKAQKDLLTVVGIGGGVTFPGMHVMLAHWAPPNERSVMSSIVYAGTALGTVISMLVSGLIAAKIGWRQVFYIEGGVSALWLFFWMIVAADTPASQKFINQDEREYIMKSLNQDSSGSSHEHESKMPWKKAFFSPAFLAILVAHTCSNWGWYMVLVELPLYMKTVLKFKLENNSFLTALPFLTMWIFSMVFSKIMDHLRTKGIITTTTARKIATGVASVIPLICFVLLCYVEGQAAGVALMTLAVTAIGGMFCGFLSNHIDIAPNFAGTLMAITNTVATIPGIAVPFVVSALTERDPSISSWRIMFWITVVLYVIEFIIFTIFGSGEEQAWNKVDNETVGESQPLKSPTDTARV